MRLNDRLKSSMVKTAKTLTIASALGLATLGSCAGTHYIMYPDDWKIQLLSDDFKIDFLNIDREATYEANENPKYNEDGFRTYELRLK
jgi:hypothetical protein